MIILTSAGGDEASGQCPKENSIKPNKMMQPLSINKH